MTKGNSNPASDIWSWLKPCVSLRAEGSAVFSALLGVCYGHLAMVLFSHIECCSCKSGLGSFRKNSLHNVMSWSSLGQGRRGSMLCAGSYFWRAQSDLRRNSILPSFQDPVRNRYSDFEWEGSNKIMVKTWNLASSSSGFDQWQLLLSPQQLMKNITWPFSMLFTNPRTTVFSDNHFPLWEVVMLLIPSVPSFWRWGGWGRDGVIVSLFLCFPLLS